MSGKVPVIRVAAFDSSDEDKALADFIAVSPTDNVIANASMRFSKVDGGTISLAAGTYDGRTAGTGWIYGGAPTPEDETEIWSALEEPKSRESWLNGWPRQPDWNVILLGTGIHCIGCGKFFGITTVVIDDDWPPKDATDPDWPFNEATCPICRLTQEVWESQKTWPRGKPRPLP